MTEDTQDSEYQRRIDKPPSEITEEQAEEAVTIAQMLEEMRKDEKIPVAEIEDNWDLGISYSTVRNIARRHQQPGRRSHRALVEWLASMSDDGTEPKPEPGPEPEPEEEEEEGDDLRYLEVSGPTGLPASASEHLAESRRLLRIGLDRGAFHLLLVPGVELLLKKLDDAQAHFHPF